MKYSAFNNDVIKRLVNFYNDNSEYAPLYYIGKTIDETKKNMVTKYYKYKDKLKDSLNVYLENKDLLTHEAIFIIESILKDDKLWDKLRFIPDGSGVTNRIWSHSIGEKITISISFESEYFNIECPEFFGENDDKSLEKQIKFLYENFDIIFIQIDLIENRNDIHEIIINNLMNNLLF